MATACAAGQQEHDNSNTIPQRSACGWGANISKVNDRRCSNMEFDMGFNAQAGAGIYAVVEKPKLSQQVQ